MPANTYARHPGKARAMIVRRTRCQRCNGKGLVPSLVNGYYVGRPVECTVCRGSGNLIPREG